jgi:hypothetical protein
MTITRTEIDNDFAFEHDGRCITLLQKVIMTGEGRGAHKMKAENIGKSRDVECGHYGRLDQALMAYVSRSGAAASPDVKAVLAKLVDIEKNLERFKVKCQALETATLVEA